MFNLRHPKLSHVLRPYARPSTYASNIRRSEKLMAARLFSLLTDQADRFWNARVARKRPSRLRARQTLILRFPPRRRTSSVIFVERKRLLEEASRRGIRVQFPDRPRRAAKITDNGRAGVDGDSERQPRQTTASLLTGRFFLFCVGMKDGVPFAMVLSPDRPGVVGA